MTPDALIGAVIALGGVTLTLLTMVVATAFRAGRESQRIDTLEGDAKDEREAREQLGQAHWRLESRVAVTESKQTSTDKFRAQTESKTWKDGK